jgi:phospholipase/carboxylesterase
MMARYDRYAELDNTLLLAVAPMEEWYPAPRGANNQMEAVWGLKLSVPEFNDFIEKIEQEYQFPRSKVALVGFSAGAVMAIQAAAWSDKPYAAVVAHNGAILEPSDLPRARHDTPFLLLHNENDDCFSWDERYLPMKIALIDKRYNLEVIENDVGGHYISPEDVGLAGDWLRRHL